MDEAEIMMLKYILKQLESGSSKGDSPDEEWNVPDDPPKRKAKKREEIKCNNCKKAEKEKLKEDIIEKLKQLESPTGRNGKKHVKSGQNGDGEGDCTNEMIIELVKKTSFWKSEDDDEPKDTKDKCKHKEKNEHEANCICPFCEKMKSNIATANAIKLIEEEEKRKKKNEKKKAQKKRAKERKKQDGEPSPATGNSNEQQSKETIEPNKNENESQHKNGGPNINKNNKNLITKDSQSQIAAVINKKVSPSTSLKKGEKEAEEEEILMNCAYVSQIAQRKSKPNQNPKGAQTKNETQQQNNKDDNDKDKDANNKKDVKQKEKKSNIKKSKSVQVTQDEINSHLNVNEVNNNSPKPIQEPKKKKLTKKEQEIEEERIERSENLGRTANELAIDNRFHEAIQVFIKAIELNSQDYRFYLNRSYCYEQIKDYRAALKDAEMAIEINPSAKGFFRKGCSLVGLKNYQEAEIAFKKVLEFDQNCKEAIEELQHVKFSALKKMGYDEQTAACYAKNFDSVKSAINALSKLESENLKSKQSSLMMKMNNKTSMDSYDSWTQSQIDEDEIYFSDDEDYEKMKRQQEYGYYHLIYLIYELVNFQADKPNGMEGIVDW